MTAVDAAGIARTLPEWSLAFVEPASDRITALPERWRPIALADRPETRYRMARSLWNQDFLDLVPRFATAMDGRCVDVRACLTDGCAALVYVMADEAGGLVSWVGYDPRTFGPEPVFWPSFPEPLRAFLRGVHAGFVSGCDGTSFGLARPVHMTTLAEFADFPEGIPGWDEDEIESTRLLRVTSDGGNVHYCLSPELAPGEIALVHEGEVDARDCGAELDELMVSHFAPSTRGPEADGQESER
ncbi:hypothetical protein [Streptomyces sp. CBMA123]|uniref:hypothetical protein n=1 Tax=Streptomyces sp. CBMA123 TaxID=1896313 RepID=UPI001661BE66|nr:hypothetical protein [Streptomyces sp. CBMA123]MBD0692143.1 hypothetical protein [Streptomyces sp. CBMA123]